MEDFKKINLEKNNRGENQGDVGEKGDKSRRKLRVGRRGLLLSAFFGVLGVLLIFGLGLPASLVYGKAKEAVRVGKEAATAIKKQDIDLASEKLKETEEKLTDLEKTYKLSSWLGYVPVVGGYYRDGAYSLKAGLEFVKAGQIAIYEIAPYADLLGLTGGGSSFVEQSADKRIETAVTTFSKVTPKLSLILEHLKVALEEIEKINPKRYPAKIGGRQVRAKIEEGKNLAEQTIGLFVNARPLLEVLPELLGEPKEKRYLVLFQNDKELRPTGGFITAYALFRFNKGKMIIEKSEDIYVLDERQKKRIGAPPEILKYHKGVYYFNLRDSNLAPDFFESMKQFEALYQTIGGAEDIDGIIAVDTHVLVEAIKVLDGEIFVPEYNSKFTIEPDERCNGCPQVIYELEEYADRPVGYFRGSRKDIIGRLLYHLMQKSLGVSPSQYWGRLVQMALTEIQEKHILAYMHDEAAQKGIEALNFAGRIKDYDGDFLHINDTNFAGAKSNMFVEHYIKQDIEISKDSSVVKTIVIDYKNPAPPSDCSLESGQLCLNGLLRNWLRVYVPQGSELLSFTGSEMDVVVSSDLGKTVFEGFLIIRPLGSAQVVVKYKLPFKVDSKEYRLLMQKQPGTEGHEYTVLVNGKEVEKFNLTTDKEVKFKI